MGEGEKIGDANNNPFAKTICSICYEDLKPTVEDLQSISVCGHVFHELCLQQWFEYCPNARKRNCPICKQPCTNANVARLYFQSIGDADSCSQKPLDNEDNPEELRKELNKLEGKVGALASSLEQKQKEFKEVKDQLLFCSEQLKAEVALKNESLAKVATSQQSLRMKIEALNKSNAEYAIFKERNTALAKELAAHKLASDLDLEEDEIVNLASFGNDVGSRDTIDTLKKSLIIRNKRYKELMAKCNVLGRREAGYQRKLEKASAKIQKLKLKVQELEAITEMKDNETLRVLKDQSIKVKNNLHENSMNRNANQIDLDENTAMPDITFCSKKEEPCKTTKRKSTMDDNSPGFTVDQNEKVKRVSLSLKDEDVGSSTFVQRSCKSSMPHVDYNAHTDGCDRAKPESCYDMKNDVEMVNSDNKDGVSCSLSMKRCRKSDHTSNVSTNLDDELICLGDSIPAQTSVRIINETGSSVPVSPPDGHWFSGGFLGPDGTSSWHLGKWCKKVKNQGSTGLQGSNSRAGDLIAVGADGRGGKIKVMRSFNQSSSDVKNTTSWGKKCINDAKPIKPQPHGFLQIEHFFQKSGQ